MATAAAAAPLRCCHRLSSGKSCVCASSVLPPRDFNAAVEAHRVQIHWDPLLELDAPTRPPSALEEPWIARDALILQLACKGKRRQARSTVSIPQVIGTFFGGASAR